jgi:hypothetical protein
MQAFNVPVIYADMWSCGMPVFGKASQEDKQHEGCYAYFWVDIACIVHTLICGKLVKPCSSGEDLRILVMHSVPEG